MPAWKHITDFRHYLQLYPQGDTEYDLKDIEAYFRCRYVSLENAETPSVKSVYNEDWAESEGQKVYTSPNVVHNSSELTLTLRWRSDECGNVQEWSDKFLDYVAGKKLEYHDTLRLGKYWQLIFKDSPVVKAEKLYGEVQYKFVSYKFTNFGGKPKKASVLQSTEPTQEENV